MRRPSLLANPPPPTSPATLTTVLERAPPSQLLRLAANVHLERRVRKSSDHVVALNGDPPILSELGKEIIGVGTLKLRGVWAHASSMLWRGGAAILAGLVAHRQRALGLRRSAARCRTGHCGHLGGRCRPAGGVRSQPERRLSEALEPPSTT